jgi:hypothetical protein
MEEVDKPTSINFTDITGNRSQKLIETLNKFLK